MLTEKAKELIPKARIFTLAHVENLYPESVITIFQQADDKGEYLSDSDLEKIENILPELSENLKQAKLIRDKSEQIVEQARQKVLLSFPNIIKPNGELYPPERASACWRDFWHFLRCIHYGIAGKITAFTNSEGLKNMELLYQELKVPLPAMILGLDQLKYFSLENFSTEEQENITTYFVHLIEEIKKIKPEENKECILLSHNFNLTENILPELTREEFAEVFCESLRQHKNIDCYQLSHFHWMVKITFPIDEISPIQVGELCVEALAEKRKHQISEEKLLPSILFLAGKKKTPPLNDNPEGLQTGQWGADVVETNSATDFLLEMGWEEKTSGKNEDEVFKICKH